MRGSTVSGRALLRYTDGARESIHRFKYEDQWSYAPAYAGLAAEEEPATFRDAACLVPIPIHKSRMRTRGYNQALVLAEALSRETGIPVCELDPMTSGPENALVPQAEEMIHSLPPGDLLLIDDIYTSGSTIEEAARTLEQTLDGRKVRFFTLALKTVSSQGHSSVTI